MIDDSHRRPTVVQVLGRPSQPAKRIEEPHVSPPPLSFEVQSLDEVAKPQQGDGEVLAFGEHTEEVELWGPIPARFVPYEELLRSRG